MKIPYILAIIALFSLTACGEPTEQEQLVGGAQDLYVSATEEGDLTARRTILRAAEDLLREAYELDPETRLGQRIIHGRAVGSSVATTNQKIELDIIMDELDSLNIALHTESAHNLISMQSGIRRSFLGLEGQYLTGDITARLDAISALPSSISKDENNPQIYRNSLGHRVKISSMGDSFTISYENISKNSCKFFLTALYQSLGDNNIAELENFKNTLISSSFNRNVFSLEELTEENIETLCNSGGRNNRLDFAFQ